MDFAFLADDNIITDLRGYCNLKNRKNEKKGEKPPENAAVRPDDLRSPPPNYTKFAFCIIGTLALSIAQLPYFVKGVFCFCYFYIKKRLYPC